MTRFALLGGFLGAGKTTLIGQIAQRDVAAGKTVGIITNDQAADLVDTQNLRAQGFSVGEVAGACFCCSFDEMVATADRLSEDQSPDLILAEPVGSCTDLVATIVLPLQQILGSRFELAPFGVLLKPSHGERILAAPSESSPRSGFSAQAEYIFRKQLEEADYLMIGRSDTLSEDRIQSIRERLSEVAPGVPVVAVSPKEGRGVDEVIGYIESPMQAGQRLLEIDYDIYADGEAELGWVNLTATLTSDAPADLNVIARRIVDHIGRQITSDSDGAIAHVKASVTGDGTHAVANLVDNFSGSEAGLVAGHDAAGPLEAVVNARVSIDPSVLQTFCETAVRDIAGQLGLQLGQMSAFVAARTPHADPPRIGWPVNSGPVNSGPVNSGPVNSGPVNSGPVNSGPVNSGPVNSGPVNSGPVNSGRVIRLWVAGLIAGTAIIGVTSPWFVRSYVPRIKSGERSVLVLQPGSHYRWRQEGYATTTIGPRGNAGIETMAPGRKPNVRVALWGDSQAEGVCVQDSQKIAALATRLSDQPIGVVSFASSGDDCNDWIHQLQSVADSSDPSLQFDAHVFLVVELSDWSIVAEQIETDVPHWQNRITSTLPDFMIHGTRNILVDAQTDQVRGLRFTPGIVTPGESTAETVPPNDSVDLAKRFRNQLERLKQSTVAPCYLLYAPKVPAIVNGNIVTDDDQQPAFEMFAAVADAIGIEVVDLRGTMAQSAQKGKWPRGFHNGQFGVGHYNATGNAIIADALVRVVKQDSGD